jgi:predicted glycosyl hydrolase (DUF1957 family)
LRDALLLDAVRPARLAALEQQDNIFPKLDYRVYSPREKPVKRENLKSK